MGRRGSRTLGGEGFAEELVTGPVALLALSRAIVAAAALLASLRRALVAHYASVGWFEVWTRTTCWVRTQRCSSSFMIVSVQRSATNRIR